MKPLKILIEDKNLIKRAGYIIDVFSINTGVPIMLTTAGGGASIVYGTKQPDASEGKLFFLNTYSFDGPLPESEFLFLKNFGVKNLNNEIFKSHDLFGICFYLLTLMDERLDKRRDQWGCFSGEHSTLYKNGILDLPVVDLIFDYLKEVIVAHTGTGGVQEKQEYFSVIITHDVDRGPKNKMVINTSIIKKTNSLFLVSLRRILVIYYFFKYIFFDEFWLFDDWLEFEKKEGIRSTFFVYARANQPNEYDPHYDIKKDTMLKTVLKRLKEQGFEVGLHGSYNSIKDGRLFEEKKVLEEVLGTPIYAHRAHYLRFECKNSWGIYDRAGIKVDTTLGYNEYAGFRAGTSKPFYPYDFTNERPHSVVEVPMAIMDGTLFQYIHYNTTEALDYMNTVIENVRSVRGVLVVDWHHDSWQTSSWKDVYIELIRMLKAKDARFTTMKEIISGMQGRTIYAQNHHYPLGNDLCAG